MIQLPELSLSSIKKNLIAFAIALTWTIHAYAAHNKTGDNATDDTHKPSVTVKVWGARGSSPVSNKDEKKYGFNTSCVSVHTGMKDLYIFDAGTGLVALGTWLDKENNPFSTLHLFISHVHPDHIEGLHFFLQLLQGYNIFKEKQININVYTCDENFGEEFKKENTSFEGFLQNHKYHPPHCFPVGFEVLNKALTFHQLLPNTPLELATDTILENCELMHPGGATGFKLSIGTTKICYFTDHEHGLDTKIDQGVSQLAHESDLLFIDSAYTEEEYKFKRGWGHSTHIATATIAKGANIKQLALFHHDWRHSDNQIDKMVEEAKKIFPNTFAAIEGQELTFPFMPKTEKLPPAKREIPISNSNTPAVVLGKRHMDTQSK